ncbi:MAG: agmatinase [Rhodospirillales bacterium]|nr:agmatinase [Rhodospirillales bacterium]
MDKLLARPLSGNALPRFAGPATMMRLPAREDAAGLDACFIGIPLDIGTWNRSGTRFGPRQIRACRGLDLVGCDLVEVSPPYDGSGNTALLSAGLLFEMLCVLPGVPYR